MSFGRAGLLPQSEGKSLREGITDFLGGALDRGYFDAALLPMRVPAGDSFAWILLSARAAQDRSLLSAAAPIAPVMPVQGAKSLSSITRQGKSPQRIVAIMHPCEWRAAVELSKLKQLELANIFVITYDCPGVVPLGDWLADPQRARQAWERALGEWKGEGMRPLCQQCERFSMVDQAGSLPDLHIGLLGRGNGRPLLLAGSRWGEELLEECEVAPEEEIKGWEEWVREATVRRREERRQSHQELSSQVKGYDKLLKTFGKCINCHNCMRACPLCHCRQCYFESSALKLDPQNYIGRAERKGSLKFPSDTLLFHLGRMSHIALSCVSCGICEDACPMSLPVGQVVSLVAQEAQELFDYLPGESIEAALPLVTYQEEELAWAEKPYLKIYQAGGGS